MQVFAFFVFICICQLTKRLQKVRVKKLGMVDQYLLSSRLNPSLLFHSSVFVFVFSCISLYFFVCHCRGAKNAGEGVKVKKSVVTPNHYPHTRPTQTHPTSLFVFASVFVFVFVILCL